MDKFVAINADVREGLSNSGLEIYPEDYNGDILTETRFARYVTLFSISSPSDHGRKTYQEGQLMVRLFGVAGYAGEGIYEDAGTLNNALEDQKFSNNTRFGKATMSVPQPDGDNQSLVMAIYSIPFTYYE